MENQFEEYEIKLIEKELIRRPFADIAFLLDRPVEEVSAYINEFIKGTELIPHQHLIDEKKKARVPKERKPRERKKKEPKIISRLIEFKPPAQRKKEDPRYKTKVVDYSKKKTVRIDDRTVVMVDHDADPKEVKEKYFANRKLIKKLLESE